MTSLQVRPYNQLTGQDDQPTGPSLPPADSMTSRQVGPYHQLTGQDDQPTGPSLPPANRTG